MYITKNIFLFLWYLDVIKNWGCTSIFADLIGEYENQSVDLGHDLLLDNLEWL